MPWHFHWLAFYDEMAGIKMGGPVSNLYTLDDGEDLRSPVVDATAWVAPTASVIGDVVIGARSSVWFGSVLRGDSGQIKLGTETNVQDGCILHTDAGIVLELGDQVTIGHGVTLHGCTVKSGSLVGIGATVLNK
mgnify:CR=1 FL=1